MGLKLTETPAAELPAADPAKARVYQRTKLTVSLVSTGLNIFVPLLFLFLGGSEAVRNLAEGWTGSSGLTVILYVLVAGAGLQIIEFPLEFYSGFIIDQTVLCGNDL